MLIMKYSQLGGKSNYGYEEYSKDFVLDDSVTKTLGFTTENSSQAVFTAEDFDLLRNVRDSIILSCAFGSTDIASFQEIFETGNTQPFPDCKTFDPMVTNKGICHTFNAVSFNAMAKDNFYLNSFAKNYHPKESDEVEKIPGAGQQYGFHFVLDANLVGRPNPDPITRKAATFRVGLSSIFSPFDMNDPILVRAGTTTR